MSDVSAPPSFMCETAVDFDTAQDILTANALPLGSETVSLTEANGRRLAGAVRARIDAPRFDSAAMDGYAVRGDDVAAKRRDFDCIGRTCAGGTAVRPILTGETARIMTGAPVPQNISRIVMIEQCDVRGNAVHMNYGQGEKAHIRFRGSDFRIGDILLDSGHVLTPASLVAVAAADQARLTVWKRPRALIVATGDELAAPGSAAATESMTPDSLSAAICAMTQEFGGEISGSFRAGDDADEILAICRDAPADVVVLLGGASRGDRDFARTALRPLGMRLRFADIAMKPGKPLWYGRTDDSHILGLPGNPTAAFTTARLFLAPLLAGLGGGSPRDALNWREVAASSPIEANGRPEGFYCGHASPNGVALVERQAASSQFVLAQTNALVRRPAFAGAARRGELVQVLPV